MIYSHCKPIMRSQYVLWKTSLHWSAKVRTAAMFCNIIRDVVMVVKNKLSIYTNKPFTHKCACMYLMCANTYTHSHTNTCINSHKTHMQIRKLLKSDITVFSLVDSHLIITVSARLSLYWLLCFGINYTTAVFHNVYSD